MEKLQWDDAFYTGDTGEYGSAEDYIDNKRHFMQTEYDGAHMDLPYVEIEPYDLDNAYDNHRDEYTSYAEKDSYDINMIYLNELKKALPKCCEVIPYANNDYVNHSIIITLCYGDDISVPSDIFDSI